MAVLPTPPRASATLKLLSVSSALALYSMPALSGAETSTYALPREPKYAQIEFQRIKSDQFCRVPRLNLNIPTFSDSLKLEFPLLMVGEELPNSARMAAQQRSKGSLLSLAESFNKKTLIILPVGDQCPFTLQTFGIYAALARECTNALTVVSFGCSRQPALVSFPRFRQQMGTAVALHDPQGALAGLLNGVNFESHSGIPVTGAPIVIELSKRPEGQLAARVIPPPPELREKTMLNNGQWPFSTATMSLLGRKFGGNSDWLNPTIGAEIDASAPYGCTWEPCVHQGVAQ